MQTRTRKFQSVAVLATAVFALPVAGQVPNEAICALQQAVACPAFSPCERALPAAVNLPALLRFDLGANVIESRLENGSERTSKIGSTSTNEDALVLQGNDDGHPWAMRIDTGTGQFTLTVVREQEGFTAFGVCSAKILK